MSHLNVEIKARCADHERVRAVLRARGARFVGTDHQIDTYFRAAAGRFKLREGRIENALIHYDREDTPGPKRTHVTLFATEPGSALGDLLRRALEVATVVDKEREIYFLDNVKVHLDTVAGLGTFVEFEAIDLDGTRRVEELRAQVTELMDACGVRDDDLLALSYSDMLLRE